MYSKRSVAISKSAFLVVFLTCNAGTVLLDGLDKLLIMSVDVHLRELSRIACKGKYLLEKSD